jgi:hypothetical protein
MTPRPRSLSDSGAEFHLGTGPVMVPAHTVLAQRCGRRGRPVTMPPASDQFLTRLL